MSHDHHHPAVTSYHRAFAIGISLNLIFVIVEAGYGFYAGSLALLADAGHNLSDVLSLLLAWGAIFLATKAATKARTYGYRKVTILAALMSSVALFIALGAMSWEAINRLFEPQPVAGGIVIVVAMIGVVINTVTALLFMRGQKHDLNIRAAFLHMAADAGVSLGVVIAGVIMLYSENFWIDPLITLLIVIVVFLASWGLLRESMNQIIDSVPESVDIDAITAYLQGLDSVQGIHDLHIWAISSSEVALTVHLLVDTQQIENEFLHNIQHHLQQQFGISHSTIQIERDEDQSLCLLNREHCH